MDSPTPGITTARRFVCGAGLAFAALSLAGMALTGPARASGPGWNAAGNLVDVRVLIDGRPAPLFFAPGRSDRQYFEASHGRNYSLEVRNNTGRRVGVLISVDGLNVVSGERSGLSGDETMYVLDPWERAEIRGWRTSLTEVRRFVFVDEDRSYAERTGQANGDMGWIRVLAFREAGRLGLQDNPGPMSGGSRGDPGRREGAAGDPGESREPARGQAQAVPPAAGSRPEAWSDRKSRDTESSPGTGWGRRSADPVTRTWFIPEPGATDQIVLRYEYASGLLALGIDTRCRRDRLWEREQGELGFAQPPKW